MNQSPAAKGATDPDLRAWPAGWDCHVHVFDAAQPVRDGHYRPATHALPAIETRAAANGVGHLVLVQPSVYGSDASLLLRALRATPGRHRGVTVLDSDVDDATLDAQHAAGVRGARLNLVSPVGHAGDPSRDALALGGRLRGRGWHLQWYVRPTQLATLAALQSRVGLPFVIDHLAGLTPAHAHDASAWRHLAALADGGAWLKLSGWYRLDTAAPFEALHGTIARAATLFGDRLVWGSDWPHTSLGDPVTLPYDATWAPVVAALGEAHAEAIRLSAPRRLYDA